MSADDKYLLKALIFLLPAWAPILAVTLIVKLHISGSSETPTFLFFFFIPIIGSIPIFQAESFNPILKLILFIFYAAAAVIAIFIVGWGTFLFFWQH
jgi:hypothetical protein